ncbi:MAG: DUF2098 domain-containing protein [Methanomicrobiales archaeon]|nr:DUF2098 domain-containing protein [Methanomicrobiales archaeon]
MDTGEIAVGMVVRYPRTGTRGKVERLEEIGGEVFAQIDCTHLLYRVDQLVNAEEAAKQGEGLKKDFRESLEKERDFARDQEAWKNIDQSCEGGG